jgi:hypothetical protein
VATYRRGAKGPEVERIQSRLRTLGRYAGPIDGDFGGGTETSIMAFQRATGLTCDGVVGPETWTALFSDEPLPEPAILARPLNERCLALTGSFETSAAFPDCFAGLSGDFDGQGISFGVCQWNFGQGSLPPLLRELDRTLSTVVDDIFHSFAAEFRRVIGATLDDQMAWARSIQDGKHRVAEPWRGLFKTLGRSAEFRAIQTLYAGHLLDAAHALCGVYCVRSQRALALMFDIKVQNGSIGDIVRAQIERDFAALPPTDDPDAQEVARLRIIANRRAEAASAQWVEDVRIRKLTIANGEGTVHGRHYSLADQYGLTLLAA